METVRRWYDLFAISELGYVTMADGTGRMRAHIGKSCVSA
jgi:hypothetical protein